MCQVQLVFNESIMSLITFCNSKFCLIYFLVKVACLLFLPAVVRTVFTALIPWMMSLSCLNGNQRFLAWKAAGHRCTNSWTNGSASTLPLRTNNQPLLCLLITVKNIWIHKYISSYFDYISSFLLLAGVALL